MKLSTMRTIIFAVYFKFSAFAIVHNVQGWSQSSPTATLSVASIPTFDIDYLFSDQQDSHAKFQSALLEDGIIALRPSDVSNYANIRQEALSSLCSCAPNISNMDGTDSVSLAGGTVDRTTIGTATIGLNNPLPLPFSLSEKCGNTARDAMDALRDEVASVSDVFVSFLDKLIHNTASSGAQIPILRENGTHGKSYNKVADIVDQAHNLEHFHFYEKKDTQDYISKESRNALDLHVDAGLFLSFVPGLTCDDHNLTKDQSFHLKSSKDGMVRPVAFEDGVVVIMMGVGAKAWLHTGLDIKPTVHAVRMEGDISSRAWYGMMHLVPENAIIHTNPEVKTFGDMRKSMILSPDKNRVFDDIRSDLPSSHISMGCGNDDIMSYEDNDPKYSELILKSPRRRRLVVHSDASACDNESNFFCWLTCLDIPDSDNASKYIKSGYSLYCLDPSILVNTGSVAQGVDTCQAGNIHKAACTGSWQPTVEGVPSANIPTSTLEPTHNNHEEKYCYGGTSMYMNGFQWTDSTCLIYLIPGFVLSDRSKFVFASLGTVVMGVVMEAILNTRRFAINKMKPGLKRLVSSALFYATQMTLGYMLMLVAMTYSGPLFMCLIIGLSIGHILFNAKDALWPVLIKCLKKSYTESFEQKEKSKGCDSSANKTDDLEEEDFECCCAETEAARNETGACTKARIYKKKEEISEGLTPCCQHIL